MKPLRFTLTLLAGCTLIQPAQAQTQGVDCRPWQRADAARRDLLIGDIRIENSDIFNPDDPKENRWYNRTANRLHINTRADIIERHLLFRAGDRFDADRMAESERLLRAQKYIKEAKITPQQLCGNQVNIRVHTTDNWTLTPGLSIGRSGGNNSSSLEVEEHNLLGFGKSLSLSYQHDSERNQTRFGYFDPHFLGSHRELRLATQNNTDGQGYELGLRQPFYAFDSRTAWGFEASVLKQEQSFYQQGEVVSKTGEDRHSGKVFYGWSAGRQEDAAQRYLIGWQYERKAWFPTDTTPHAPPALVQSYPWIGYEYVQDDYTVRENFRTMGKTEDIALGHRLAASAGVLHKSLGADGNYLKLDARYSKGFMPGEKQLGLVELESSAWLGNGRLQGGRARLKLEWNHFSRPHSSWYLGGELNVASNLLPGEQVLLGGDNGLRGYPTGYQSGDKSLVLNAEKRFFFNWYPLRMARVGAAVFADVGTAWGQGHPAEWLGDVGLGLRIVSTRSSSGKNPDMIRRCHSSPNTRRTHWLIGTETHF
ncbi:MAG: hypothetical protein R3E89_16610 [Thiolinea sp.]